MFADNKSGESVFPLSSVTKFSSNSCWSLTDSADLIFWRWRSSTSAAVRADFSAVQASRSTCLLIHCSYSYFSSTCHRASCSNSYVSLFPMMSRNDGKTSRRFAALSTRIWNTSSIESWRSSLLKFRIGRRWSRESDKVMGGWSEPYGSSTRCCLFRVRSESAELLSSDSSSTVTILQLMILCWE